MKRVKWYLVLLLVGILLFVSGCTEEPLVIPPVIPVTPTLYSSISIPIEEFPNHPHIDVVMHAVVGEELTITLGSNPTTGFQWSEDAEISDETIVQQVSHKFVGPETDVPGTPGKPVTTARTSGYQLVWTKSLYGGEVPIMKDIAYAISLGELITYPPNGY